MQCTLHGIPKSQHPLKLQVALGAWSAFLICVLIISYVFWPVVFLKTLLVAPGRTTRSKKLLVTKGIATSSKDVTSSSGPYY